jgi:purine catabolism regulator
MINSFGLSIRELLKLDIMSHAKILSGKSGLNRRITKMNVMEVPDILDWVTPGEFLLTTAYSIKDDIHLLDDMILKMNQKEVAGIGIKTKRYIDEIPQSIIDRSNAYGFPIVEIPYDISFSEIMLPALTEIINKQTNTLTQINDFHNRLIDTIIHGGSLQEISDAIFQSVGNPVMICEKIFKTSVLSSDNGFKGKISHIYDENYEKFDFDKTTNIKVRDKIDGNIIGRLVIPIKVDDTIYGYINIWEMNRPILPVEITVITSSTSIITLDFLKKLSIFQIENKHRTAFFDNLLSSDDMKVQRVLDSKTYFDFRPEMSYSVLVLNIGKEHERSDSYLIEKVTKAIDHLIARVQEKIIYVNKGDKIMILVGSEQIEESLTTDMRIKQMAKEMVDVVQNINVDMHFTLGIGRNYERVYDIRESYKEAMRVVEYLTSREDIKYLHFDDLGIFRILSYSELKPELTQFFKDMLEPLVQYDQEKGHELVDTLRKFFEYRGNIKKVSCAMYTHYNTIVYRMNRIKEITHMDFEDPNDYLNMQIAIKIYEILN